MKQQQRKLCVNYACICFTTLIGAGYKKVWYVDFSRSKKDYAIPYNILNLPGLSSHEIAQAFLTACRRAFPVVGSTVGLDSLLQASAQALSSAKRPATDLSTFLLNTSFRQQIVSATSDRFVNEYFTSMHLRLYQLAKARKRFTS